MPTVEELLIGFKIDEASVSKFQNDAKKTTEKISQNSTINVKLNTNANEILTKVSNAIAQFKLNVQDTFNKVGSGVSGVSTEVDKLQSSITSILKSSTVDSTIKGLTADSKELAAATNDLTTSAKTLNTTQSTVATSTTQINAGLNQTKSSIAAVGPPIKEVGKTIQQTSSQLEKTTALMGALGLSNVPGLGPLIQAINSYRYAMLLAAESTAVNTTAAQANAVAVGINGPLLRGLVALFPTFSSALGINTAAYIAETTAIAADTEALLANKAARIAASVEEEAAFVLGQGFLAGASDKDTAKLKEFLTETEELAEASVITTTKVGGLTGAWIAFKTALTGSFTQIGTAIGLTGALATAVTALSTVVAAAGAAFVGWKIGRWIDELLGLSEATERLVKGTSTWLDILKSPFTLNPLVVYYSEAASAARDAQKANEEWGKSFLNTIPGATAQFERLTKEGLNFNQAFSQAIDLTLENKKQQGRLRYEYLKTLAAQGKLTDANRKEYAILSAYLNPALKAEAAELEKVGKALDVKALEDAQKSFADAVAKTNDELIKQNRGKDVFDVKQLQDEFNKRLKALSDFSKLQVQVVKAGQEDLAKAGSDPAAADRATAVITEAQIKIREAYYESVSLEKSFSNQITEVINQRVEELRSLAQKEIDIEKDKADKIIAEQEKLLSKTTAEIKSLQDIRAKGLQTYQSFINQLAGAELARESPVRAELEKFVRDSVEKLSTSTFESQRQTEQFFDAFYKEVQRIAGKIKPEIDKVKNDIVDYTYELSQLKKENEKIGATPKLSAGDFQKSIAELSKNRKEAAELQGKLYDSQQKLNKLLEQEAKIQQEVVDAALAGSDAADQNIANQKEFSDRARQAHDDYIKAQNAIKDATDARNVAELKITAELQNQLALLEQQKAAYQALIAASARSAVSGGQPAALVDTSDLQTPAANIKAAAEAVKAAEQKTSLNAESIKNKADEITSGFRDTAAKIGPLFTSMAASLDAAVKSLVPITEKFSLLMASQATFGVSLSSFSEKVVNKMEVMAEAFNSQAAKLDALASRVDKIVLRRGNNEDIPAASGLPASGG